MMDDRLGRAVGSLLYLYSSFSLPSLVLDQTEVPGPQEWMPRCGSSPERKERAETPSRTCSGSVLRLEVPGWPRKHKKEDR